MAGGMTSPAGRIRLTLRRSLIGRPEGQRRIAYSLGLRRVGASRVHTRTPGMEGALKRVAHLVSVEEVVDGQNP